MERDRRQHGERTATDHVGSASGSCVRGDGAGRRLRRCQRGRPSREAVSDQPELPEGVGRGCSRDRGVQGASRALPVRRRWTRRTHASLAGRSRRGKSKDQGIEVGTMAADAMLAEGHDGRTVIGCTFGSGAARRVAAARRAGGVPLCDPSRVGRETRSRSCLKSPSQFRTAGPYALTSRGVGGRLQRGQVARRDQQRHTHRRPDSRGRVLADEPGRRTTTRSRAGSSTSSRST